MTNIRIVRYRIKSSTEIQIDFTTSLNTSVSISDIDIVSAYFGTPDLTITSVSASGKTLTILVRPMIGGAYYQMTLTGILGAHGEQFLEDGTSNVIFFVGIADESGIRDAIFSDITNVYNKESGLVFDTINAEAKQIEQLAHSVGEIGSANYVEVEVSDEEMTRGSGPYDRLANEGAFQIIRVGSAETGSTDSDTIIYSDFPSDPVSLQQIFVTDEDVSNTSTLGNSFDGLTITLAQRPIITVTSVILIRGATQYVYDLNQYRYGIYNYKYDSTNAYPALDLADNQLRLNGAAVGPTFPLPQGNDSFLISYYYKKEGRIIDAESVDIYQTVTITREPAPAISTTFFLNHAPIVDQNGEVAISNGVIWLDPAQNFDPTKNHPAFVTELPFNQFGLPSLPGQFSVDYSTGRVFVFGVDGSGTDGTTTVPPVATYDYINTYQNGLDYVFYSDLNEIVAVPDRDLEGFEATIAFNYEDTFADGTDFVFSSHVEVIGERVENRLIDTIGLRTVNYPVNEVFRIYNETTGEIYNTTRIVGNEVYFSSVNPPKILDVSREAAQFDTSIQSQMVVVDNITIPAKSFIAFKIELSDYNVGSAKGNLIGANFNSSLSFSDTSRFLREFYFNSSNSLVVNLTKLLQIGDYTVDYVNGIVYLAQSATADTDIGDVTYKKTEIKTRHGHIIRVEDVNRSPKVGQISKTFTIGEITDTNISLTDIEVAGETDRITIDGYGNSSTTPILVDSGTIEVSYDMFKLFHVFQVTDLALRWDPIDFGVGAVISSSNLDTATLDSNGVDIEDDGDGAYLTIKLGSASRIYVEAERIASLVTAGLAELKSAVNVVGATNYINYYSYGTDGYVDATYNRVYLPSACPLSLVGESVVAKYKAQLLDGAAVMVDYVVGDMFVDYAYTTDEILVSYEYGDNVLDWTVSDALSKGDTYYVTYKYGALRTALRDNFGILTGIDKLTTIPDNLSRETYRNAIQGSLQTFPKGPTVPAIKELVRSLTQIDPNITESVFLEWILGRDYLNLEEMLLSADTESELPGFDTGKFGNGLLLDTEGQTAILPANSNLRFNEGTWEAFVIPKWAGIENDASLTFDIKFDGGYDENKIFIGSDGAHPDDVPFTLSATDIESLGVPSVLHSETGYFIWYDIGAKKWRFRVRAPVGIELRSFTGNITTSGEFYNVTNGATADGYDGYYYQDGYFNINEATDKITSTDTKIKFSFIIDAYDSYYGFYDSYDSYSVGVRGGFDGIDFSSDNIHYFFDTGVDENYCRLSLFKDGKGYIKFRVYDGNRRAKVLSCNIQDWEKLETHHLACSWKMGTVEQRDELHLFVDGAEVPNTYRYRGYVDPPVDAYFMDPNTEILVANVTSPIVGGFDLETVSGSNIVTSAGSTFITSGIQVGDKFEILDDTVDGISTRTSPYVYVSALTETTLTLQTGLSVDFNLTLSLEDVRFTINALELTTVSDNDIERVRVFAIDSYGAETELYVPDSLVPQYDFSSDGYVEYVNVYDGVNATDSIVLKSYGLMQSRFRQYVYIWPDLRTNLLNTIMPQPTSTNKIKITKVLLKRINIDPSTFALISTIIGGHTFAVLTTYVTDFCQPSNSVTGRQISVSATGSNIDWTGLNQVVISGTTYDGSGAEVLTFTEGSTQSTTKFFMTISDIYVAFTPLDATKKAGTVEIRETHPINWQENSGDYAQVFLSVQQQAGINGQVSVGGNTLIDAYSRFGEEDIGKLIVISSPGSVAGTYKIDAVALDPSLTVEDSDTITLTTYSGGAVSWGATSSVVVWKMLSTSYGDSGFANGLITLEIADSGGQPYLLGNCWYEVDFPTYLEIPLPEIPRLLYIGSNFSGTEQANAVIDEMRIMDEMSVDTGRGSPTPSSGRSVTTDALIVREMETTTQTLGLFHFDDDVTNSASFYSSFSAEYIQSENSVNSTFNQSAIFNGKYLEIDNKSVFDNDEGTIEFWVSPILDTYNDPTKRYFIDLSPAQQVTLSRVLIAGQSGIVSDLTIVLPVRARSISSVTITGKTTNYYNGGSLSDSGLIITLGQALPKNIQSVIVTYVPITSQGDRFSLYKDETGAINLLVTASGTDYQITAPVYWKKNTWHRILVEWSFNNSDNQDQMMLLIDGTEVGTIRYGTGLIYGAGSLYGSPTVWGSATAGTLSARNILSDINLTDIFNEIYIGADFTGQYPAMVKMDNIRFSSSMRPIVYLGGSGPGQLIGKDIFYTSNLNTANPVISDALTRLLLDFDTDPEEVVNLAMVRNATTGIFDFFVEVIDSFRLIDTDLAHELLVEMINQLKPAHTRAFVTFTK